MGDSFHLFNFCSIRGGQSFFSRLAGLLGFLFLLGATPFSSAKDMTGRLGIGFINSFSNSTSSKSVPAISAKYGFSKDFAALGAFGIHSETPGAYTLGAKIFRNVFYETHLNFYLALAGALLKGDHSGVEGQALFGSEVFLPGVDSLGLSFEAGVAMSNVSGEMTVRTLGWTFLNAGVHFYF